MDEDLPRRFVFGYRAHSPQGREVPVSVILDEAGVHVRQESAHDDVAWDHICAAGETADSGAGNRHLCLLEKGTLRRILVPCSEDQFPALARFVAARIPFLPAPHGGAPSGPAAVAKPAPAGPLPSAQDVLLAERRRQVDDRIAGVPPLPAGFIEALNVATNALSSVVEFEKIIARNRALTGRILKLANSPRYARARKVAKVAEALTLLGFSTTRDIVLGFTLSRAFPKDVQAYGLAEYGAWRHGMAVALAGRTLARRLGLEMEKEEEFFLALLAHDVGKVLLAPVAREQEGALLRELARCDNDLPPAEQRVLGFDHQEVGARVAQHWGFSRQAQEVAQHHHQAGEAEAFRRSVALAHLADHLVHGLRIGETPRPFPHARLDPGALDVLALTAEQVAQAESWIAEEEVTYRMMANQLA